MSLSLLSRLAASLLRVDRPQERTAVREVLAQFARLSVEERARAQLMHLELYLRGVMRLCPFYEDRFREWADSKPLGWDAFAKLPLTTRSDIQTHGPSMRVRQPRGTWLPLKTISTSGSTGQPIRTEQTLARAVLQKELATAWHLRHRRDFDADTAFITEPLSPGKADPPLGWTGPAWGADQGSGRGRLLTLNASPQEQLAWLSHTRAKYLVTYPSNLSMLLATSMELGVVPEGIQEIMLSSEPIADALVQKARQKWNARVVGTYSSSELGVIALQEPDGQYDCQDASVLVEVLDEDGAPTSVGEVGRVVVTTLQEALRPLIRYEVGDYARVERGPEGQRRLGAIVGRKRTMIETRTGKKRWPYFELDEVTARDSIRQWQLVQHRDRRLTISVVALGSLTEEDRLVIRRSVDNVSEGLPLEVVQVDTIRRSPSGKYHEVISELE